MSMLSRLMLISMALLCAAAGLAQQESSAPKPAEARLFELPVAAAQGRRVVAFEFSAAGAKYHIARTGLGTRSAGAAAPQAFNLHLSKGDFIRALYFAEYENDALLLIEVTNGAYGAGF